MDLSAIGKQLGPSIREYDEKDVIFYNLSIGAQPEDSLEFVYENAPGGLRVIPSFGVLFGHELQPELASVLKLDPLRSIHGEHSLRVHRPLPPHGKTSTTLTVENIYDKRKAALIITRVETKDEEGECLVENVAVTFYVGGGGFGGDPGPKAERIEAPQGAEPEFRVAYQTAENQAALYRLNGDMNPLHIDPAGAKTAGFDRPILHGLCTFGFATRAIVEGACGGDVARFRELRTRLSEVVFPGETLITEGWKDKGNQGRYIIQTRTERAVVLSNAYAVIDS